ncbi:MULTISPECIES: tRNA(Ile)(2)-agmatinylcytidine synthase [unclassified Methanoculleus]|uniref:tRNA(Ile)(2)-agmatinylcytidine synthase n=1 Tax=unclassified Methanoculleus TaxID=2619537 RepID=UPI0025D6BCD6|nr:MULTISPECIES: tRNA(Ile)(2)-agmatinylcytidine synthase [unclassified Methanoculleus]MCK9319079.1 tRNA(Ile)(2)-agmatinylcytidine synthase [Methanoculleus sp.]MDD2252804.1 tRNA(Ile)(2)-agmatinylcytidine synthase [Methanoculleus sp.]MDD2787567.1 tRNA(Ile)(2)-agmatinylcytidine synthase [Methanoculleus sp.]MDD3215213.1 tRNA(Ile)(2)-agmatinylcytidine synthase [Methanoculleus sp.]MDD4313047.1 tRNA(Ile)(2)-agmatinylcytidine synthase [Methanoculleus sp.]
MWIGIDDTDSPAGMCTTYIGAVLVRRLAQVGMRILDVRLIRLNPNVIHKTRGNAAVSIEAEGNLETGFRLASTCVEELAEFDAPATNPGVAVSRLRPPPDFYRAALREFCTVEEAIEVLESVGARYRGYKNRRGLIGATAAIASDLPDRTYELLAYRKQERWGAPRQVDRASFFCAEEATYPRTWDTVDRANDVVVCVPHTPDPVLFGIRGESPAWVREARTYVVAEEPACEQVYATNQGTDAHLAPGTVGELREGRSYLVRGTVAGPAVTGVGGHVSFPLVDEEGEVRCMAYEPTKGFRDVVRALVPGDGVAVAGSYKGGSLNLEKIGICRLADTVRIHPPLCPVCGRRMTSAGAGKGYKCRVCSERSREPEVEQVERRISPGWYEVPPTARRHLARPLVRGVPAWEEAVLRSGGECGREPGQVK